MPQLQEKTEGVCLPPRISTKVPHSDAHRNPVLFISMCIGVYRLLGLQKPNILVIPPRGGNQPRGGVTLHPSLPPWILKNGVGSLKAALDAQAFVMLNEGSLPPGSAGALSLAQRAPRSKGPCSFPAG